MSLFNSRLDRENVPPVTQLIQVAPLPHVAGDLDTDLPGLERSELGVWLARTEPRFLDQDEGSRYLQLIEMEDIRWTAKGLLEAEADQSPRPREYLKSLNQLLLEYVEPCITWPGMRNDSLTEPVPAEQIAATVINQHLLPQVGFDIILQLRYYVGRTGWARRCAACGSAFLVTRSKQQFCSHRCSVRVSARRRRSEEKRAEVGGSNAYAVVY